MPFTARILLLGSDELGREFTISAERLGASPGPPAFCNDGRAGGAARFCAVQQVTLSARRTVVDPVAGKRIGSP